MLTTLLRICVFTLGMVFPILLHAESWRGLTVVSENRCSPYRASQYSYTQTLENRLIESMGAVYGPYTDTCFDSAKETDIEHIVARSEAHDSGLCSESSEVKKAFARDLLTVTLASPHVNRDLKGDKDAADWLPQQNRCWFANRVIEIKRKYGMTVDAAERNALEAVLSECDSTTMSPVLCPNRFIPHIAQGQGWETRLHFTNQCSQRSTVKVAFKNRHGRSQSFITQGFPSGLRPDQTAVAVFPDTGSRLIQGYAHVTEDADGCIRIDVEYRQHLGDGTILFATVPEQAMNTNGTLLSLPPQGCTIGIAVAAGGGHLRMEAYDAQGHLRGSADLDPIYHDAFEAANKIPALMSLDVGQIRVIGKAAVLGLDFCGGHLAQFRLGHPLEP